MKLAVVLILVCISLSMTEAFKKKKKKKEGGEQDTCDYNQFDCDNADYQFYLNYCNVCTCIEEGEAEMCGTATCDYPKGMDPRNCTVGTSWWENKCRYCCCQKDIGVGCVQICSMES